MNWRTDLSNFISTNAVPKGSFRMHRDDMTHMEAVFLPIDRDRPALPYDEFIVNSGRHPNGTFEKKLGGHYYAKYEFPNGRKVSVVCGQLFYSRIDAPYEVMFEDEDEPHGYQTDEELMILLAKAIGDA
jgi:hypothetical protein